MKKGGLISFLVICIVLVPFKFLLGLDWILAVLFGSFLASTDLTILGPVLSNIKLNPRISEYLELESTLNTVISAVLVIILVNLIESPVTAAATEVISEGLQTLLYHIFVGVGLGALFGFLILWSVRHMTLDELPHIIMIGALFA